MLILRKMGEDGRRAADFMRHTQRWTDDEGEEAGANRQTASLAGLALTLLLVVLALGLTQVLRHKAAIEDCLMAGRINCAVLLEQDR